MKLLINNKIVAVVLLLALFANLQAQKNIPLTSFKKIYMSDNKVRYKPIGFPQVKIGVALSGGGTRGIAHISFLKALEELGIPLSGISGSSIGALIGGWYVMGYTPEEIRQLIYEFDWKKLYSDRMDRKYVIVPQKEKMSSYIISLAFDKDGPFIPNSLSYGQNILNHLILTTSAFTYNHDKDYRELSIPFNIVTTDMLYGSKVVFYSGNLSKTVLASMAFPLLLAPVEHDSLLLVDGGIIDNIPVDEVKKLGADFVIANDVAAGTRSRKNLKLPWQIADQVTTIMMQTTYKDKYGKADLVITPPLKKYTSTDISHFQYFYDMGSKAVIDRKKELIKLINDKYGIKYSLDSLKVKKLEENFRVGDSLIFRSYNMLDTIIVLNAAYLHWKKKYCFDDIEIYYDKKAENLSVSFGYEPGETVVQSDDSLFNKKLDSLFADKPFLKYISGDMLKEKIGHFFREQGYFACKMKWLETNGEKKRFVISPGKFDSVIVEGNHTTKEYVIKRELAPELFQRADLVSLNRSLKNIYGTGLFHLVEIYPFQRNNRSILKITVKEKLYLKMQMGTHYNMDRKPEAIIALTHENLLGRKLKWETAFTLGSYRKKILMELKSDKIYKSHFSSFLRWQASTTDYPIYEDHVKKDEFNVSTREVEAGLGKVVERLGFVAVSIFNNNVRSITSLTNGNIIRYHSWGFRLLSIVDDRDIFPFPNSGKYVRWGWESYNQYEDQNLNTAKAWLHADKYKKISKYTVWHIFTYNGIAENTLPFHNRFKISTEIRKNGWHIYEYYGKMYIISGFEWRQQFFPYVWGKKYLSLKYDIGHVWLSSEEKLKWSDMENGLSLGLMFSTVLGPIELRYEVSEGRKPLLWFNIGYNF